MRCRKCGRELLTRPCRTCLDKFLAIRTQVWNELVEEMGKPTKENMPLFQKKFKKKENKLLMKQKAQEGL